MTCNNNVITIVRGDDTNFNGYHFVYAIGSESAV